MAAVVPSGHISRGPWQEMRAETQIHQCICIDARHHQRVSSGCMFYSACWLVSMACMRALRMHPPATLPPHTKAWAAEFAITNVHMLHAD